MVIITGKKGDNLIYTPPKFNSSPLRNDGWKNIFLLGRAIFKGYVKLPGSIYPISMILRTPIDQWDLGLGVELMAALYDDLDSRPAAKISMAVFGSHKRW